MRLFYTGAGSVCNSHIVYLSIKMCFMYHQTFTDFLKVLQRHFRWLITKKIDTESLIVSEKYYKSSSKRCYEPHFERPVFHWFLCNWFLCKAPLLCTPTDITINSVTKEFEGFFPQMVAVQWNIPVCIIVNKLAFYTTLPFIVQNRTMDYVRY